MSVDHCAMQLAKLIRRAKELGVVGEQADDELAVETVIRTLERLGTLEDRRTLMEGCDAALSIAVHQANALRATIDAQWRSCDCRTRSCQHGAHLHHNGVCEVCNAGLCWC